MKIFRVPCFVLVVLGGLSVVSFPLTVLAAQATGSPIERPAVPPSLVVTTVTEEVEISPDRASVAFTVETRAKTAAGAGAENARIQSTVLDTLRKLGIAPAQLRTRGLSINPEYEYPKEGGRPTVVGYQAQNSVQVEVRQLTLLGSVIDAALFRGATNVGALHFFASSTELAGREALRKAVARARADADAIAEAAGGLISGVKEITVLGDRPSVVAAELMGAMTVRSARIADTPTPIETGSLKIVVTIEAKFVLIPR